MITPASTETNQLGRFEHGIVRRKVRQLIGSYGFEEQDRESLEQELLLRILQGMRRYDQSQAHRNAFVTTIVERSVATLIRDKCAGKRDHRRIGSLHSLVKCADGGKTEIAETIGQESYDARRGRAPRGAETLFELTNDVQNCLTKLPRELRELAESLKQKSVSQIAREMGIPRTTLRERVRQLRERFESEGMRLYL